MLLHEAFTIIGYYKKEAEIFIMSYYAVVKFLDDENTFSEVPIIWLFDNNKKCWWPKSKNPAMMIANETVPDAKTWTSHRISVEGFFESLEKARKVAADMESSSSSSEERPVKKRKIKKPAIFISESSSGEENYRTKISSPPKMSRRTSSIMETDNCNDHNNIINTNTYYEDVPIDIDRFINIVEEENFNEGENINDDALETNENDTQEPCRSKVNNEDKKVEMLTSILFYVKSIDKRLKKLETNSLKTNNILDDTKMFRSYLPIKSEDECRSFNSKIIDDNLSESFINFLAGIGGKNVKDNIHRILKTLFCNEFACKCSWFGLRGNFQISNLAFIELLTSLMKITYQITDNDVECVIKEWFRLSKLRLPKK